MADIEKELAELRESQERGKISMEHSVAEASIYLQDQVRLPCFAERGPAVLRGGSPAPTHQPLLRPPPMRAFQEVTVFRARPLLTQNWLRGHTPMSTHREVFLPTFLKIT